MRGVAKLDLAAAGPQVAVYRTGHVESPAGNEDVAVDRGVEIDAPTDDGDVFADLSLDVDFSSGREQAADHVLAQHEVAAGRQRDRH